MADGREIELSLGVRGDFGDRNVKLFFSWLFPSQSFAPGSSSSLLLGPLGSGHAIDSIILNFFPCVFINDDNLNADIQYLLPAV